MRKLLSKIYNFVLLLIKLPKFIFYGNKIKMNNSISSGALLRHSTFGNYVYLGPRSSALWADIGNYTCIAGGVGIGGMNHEYKKAASINPILNPYCHMDKRIKIGNDVWIGAKCIILQGVTIGDGAIVGAGSVVTKDVLENTIVFGSPAKYYKSRFPEDMWVKIKQSRYWDYPPNEAKQILEGLGLKFPLE